MLIFRTTTLFKKDFKKAQKRGKDVERLRGLMRSLANEDSLPARHRDHALTGNYKGRRECHIEQDWLLIYKVDLKAREIIFERTGTHSDLFG
ncbi:MAG: type II toxin-antitoxin system YafQ family toxin [Nitrospirae bacterium]|nr:type II toxin-antitoxin system YafQ family toxin [Nitrospirota bacterium]